MVQQALVSELRTYLQQRLPNYMVPTTIILLDRLPLTANGKIDRRALPTPDATRDGSAHAYVAPRNRIERMLADIWIDLLNIERVGVRDNFFDLGGHSLMAMTMVAKVEKATGVRLNFLKIANSSLRVLAAGLPEEFKPPEPTGVGDRLRGLFGRITRRNN